jgi:hypothetical protein
LKLSVDATQTFTDLDWTTIFAADSTYGGWAGDQVIHYVPAIDAFVLYVQSFKNTTDKTGATMGKNVVKVALASPADPITYQVAHRRGGGSGISRATHLVSARSGSTSPT